MKFSFSSFLVLCVASLALDEAIAGGPKENSFFLSDFKSDYSEFYSPNSLMRLGLAYSAGMVSTATIDDNIQRYYQTHVRNSGTDNFSVKAKQLGEWKYIIPAALAANYFGSQQEGGLGQWGNQTFRALSVGGPGVLVMQQVTGGSRPNENKPHGAQWRPFRDNNGVSGHAFVGAVPFLTLANMHSEGTTIRYAALAASFATPLSRMNSNSHFFSQAALGWYMAYEASRAVNAFGRRQAPKAEFLPMVDGDRIGLVYSMPLN